MNREHFSGTYEFEDPNSASGIWESTIRLAPSLLSADFAAIADAIRMVENAGAQMVHIDVMDGRFVPNITWGPKIIGDLRRLTRLYFDVHLMILEPERFIEDFRKAGADGITIHLETSPHAQRTLTHIRQLGARPGIVICPSTPVVLLREIIEDVDLVLIMGVNPGFGGQAFLPNTLRKLKEARALITEQNPRCALEVDGGIRLDNIADVVAAGADTIVAGSSIFGAADPAAVICEMQQIVLQAAVAS